LLHDFETMSTFDRFLQALAFLTILPVRTKSSLTENGLFTYARFFPAAGILIGILSGAVFCLASEIWPGLVPALLAVTASLIATGALHEDGLADTADAFGGGWTREQRLAIMKDSRLGTYGVLALGLGIALKVSALALLSPSLAFFGLIAAHAGARFAPVMVLTTQDYAGDRTTAKTAYAPTQLAMPEARHAFLWTLLAMIPVLVMRPLAVVAAVVLGGALSLALALYSRKAIGGYSGDVLGAIEQLFEIGFLLGLATAWSAAS
jgi:adenosylcobinamide-GDP ribazoletransferase